MFNQSMKLMDQTFQAIKHSSALLREPYLDRTEHNFPFEVNDYGGLHFTKNNESKENPVILSHGLYRNARDMNSIAEKITTNTGRPVYAITYSEPAHGMNSDGSELENGAKELHDLCNKVLEHENSDSIDVVGHSFGAAIPIYMVNEADVAYFEKLIAAGDPRNGSALPDTMKLMNMPYVDDMTRNEIENGPLSRVEEIDNADLITIRGTRDGMYPFETGKEFEDEEYIETGHEGLINSNKGQNRIIQELQG